MYKTKRERERESRRREGEERKKEEKRREGRMRNSRNSRIVMDEYAKHKTIRKRRNWENI